MRRKSRGDPVRFEVLKDPRVSASDDDLRQQHDLVRQAQSLLERMHERIGALRDARGQLEAVEKRAREAERWSDELEAQAEALGKGLTEVEEELIQPKNESSQDPINFPPQIDNQIAYLYGHVAQNYGRPTGGSFERFRDLEEEAKPILERLDSLLGAGIADLNRALQEAGVTGSGPLTAEPNRLTGNADLRSAQRRGASRTALRGDSPPSALTACGSGAPASGPASRGSAKPALTALPQLPASLPAVPPTPGRARKGVTPGPGWPPATPARRAPPGSGPPAPLPGQGWNSPATEPTCRRSLRTPC